MCRFDCITELGMVVPVKNLEGLRLPLSMLEDRLPPLRTLSLLSEEDKALKNDLDFVLFCFVKNVLYT